MNNLSRAIAAALIASALLVAQGAKAAQDGAALYTTLCSGCHNDVKHPVNLVYNASGNAAIIKAVNNAGMGAAGSDADYVAIAG